MGNTKDTGMMGNTQGTGIREDTWQSRNAAQTFAWGVCLGTSLLPGDLVCLYGDLGTGKTLVAQGIGQALGIAEPVTSPTFTMIHQYRPTHKPRVHRKLPVTLVHMDLYRLRDPFEADVIGVWDYFRDENIVLIEWPEIICGDLPPDRYEVYLAGNGESSRDMRLVSLGAVRGLALGCQP